MLTRRRIFCIMILGAWALALTASAHAASLIFVSGAGSDAGNCGASPTGPCRTLQRAHDLVSSGGEIYVLDGADYGGLSIIKSVSIVNKNRGAAIVRAAGSADAVSIAATNGVVLLQGLTLDGAKTNSAGIQVSAVAQLEIVDCVIHNFVSNGVNLESSQAVNLYVLNTNISDNLGAGLKFSGAHPIKGAIEKAAIGNNVHGVLASFSVDVVVSDSVFNDQVKANSFGVLAAQGAKITLTDVIMRNNFVAASAISGGVARFNRSTIINNATAFSVSGTPVGTIESFGNNLIKGNGDDAIALLSSVAPM